MLASPQTLGDTVEVDVYDDDVPETIDPLADGPPSPGYPRGNRRGARL